MKKKIILLCILIAALVFEALPNGVVIYYANPEGDPFRETYSYFSLTPYGYANFAPLITAILTCVLLLVVIISFINKKDLRKKTSILAGVSSLISLCPMLDGFNDYSIVGAMISLCLIAATVIISFKKS
ncbi:MAG: hypothetical protein J6S71_01850 [Clostridia bacterium]|nr:hypothetical protein [Clostridia bacterium]